MRSFMFYVLLDFSVMILAVLCPLLLEGSRLRRLSLCLVGCLLIRQTNKC